MSANLVQAEILTDNLSTAVILLDTNLNVRYLNNAAELLFGKSKMRANMHPFAELFLEHQLPSDFAENIKLGTAFTQREVEWFPLHNDHEVALDYIVNFVQIEDEEHCLLEIHSRDRFNRINRDKDFFSKYQTSRNVVRGLAHEIKNPLGGIRGAAQLLDRQFNDEQKEYTQVIIEEVDRLRALVDRMLGPVKPSVQTQVNIHRILEQILAIVQAESLDQIQLVRDYDPSLPDLHCDAEQIHQVLLNIVGNARQSLMESKTENAKITIRTRVAHQLTLGGQLHRLVCQIKIIDNGPGIPEDLQKNIFYPMVSGRANGSGLGLSIAQQFISQHKGIIEFDSHPGATVFSIILPMEKSI